MREAEQQGEMVCARLGGRRENGAGGRTQPD